MSHSLSRLQAVVLGLVVLASAGLAATGLVAVAAKQGLWADTFETTVGFPDAHDITPGTPVRVRGVDAGQVVAIEYPADDSPTAAVVLRLRLDAKFRDRLFADATATVVPTGLLGSKVVSVSPGTPAAGPLTAAGLKAGKPNDLFAAADKLAAVADEADKLLKDVRSGTGTLGKLVRDDALYDDVRALVSDARGTAQRAEQEIGKVGGFVKDGQDAVRSMQRVTDGVTQSRLGRQFIDDPARLMVRPDCRREAVNYNAGDLFEPNSAILTDAGRGHLHYVTQVLQASDKRAEVVVAALCYPHDARHTSASAAELTRKQAEAVVEFLKADKALRTSWWRSSRKVDAVGLGFGPGPVVEEEKLPPNAVQVLVFTPAS